jgi:hypothetical protein
MPWQPDLAPKRQYQKKSHEKADARGLTGAEIAQRELKAREAKARQITANRERATVTPDKEDEGQMPTTDNPPRPRQVLLPIRSPEALRSRPSLVFTYSLMNRKLLQPPSIDSTRRAS